MRLSSGLSIFFCLYLERLYKCIINRYNKAMTVADRIKTELERRAWNVRQLAELADVPEQTLFAWLRRDSANLNVERLARVAAALGVTTDYLITGDKRR